MMGNGSLSDPVTPHSLLPFPEADCSRKYLSYNIVLVKNCPG